MDARDLTSRLLDLLATERWADEGGRIPPGPVLDRERDEARHVLGSFSQFECEKDSEETRE
jgi:hypothetical protein